MSEKCYLNGEFLPLAEAKISVLDRGFLFGDGVYEVLPVFNRRAPFLERHLRRLRTSLSAIALDKHIDIDGLRAPILRCIADCAAAAQTVYVHISRGEEARRQHLPPLAPTPTIFMLASALAPPPAAPLKCVSETDFRWQRGHIKATALLGAVLLAHQARERGAAETMLFRDNYLTEGYKSNYIIVKNGELFTPPRDNNILHGISCEVALEVAQEIGLRCHEQPISKQDIEKADEILICASSRGVLAVDELDEIAFAGASGDIYTRLRAAWDKNIERLTADG